ncbi:ribosomal protein [Plasmopara halstedii]|uniref:Palmitoyltransferase n=1 Tax=Plasmopara halstedii TaxID=4781 RepID=A0A0P1AWW6_PLAHL|nr:ribosomal protein [Plasmopara halstedii]CEG45677.1 ribosomal protein [Plasmopara halstedii]|eukprot:XP_024582046.1 ribosomal protein [Plasmopara halstedii]
MPGNKNEEVAALEALRDSSADLVCYLESINQKLMQMNEQNEMSLRVLENWSSVIAISKISSSSTVATSLGKSQEKELQDVMRTTGLDLPFSRDQVTSWVIELILIGSFISFVTTLLSRDKCLAILLPNALLVTIFITSWCICEVRDPSKPKPTSLLPSLLKIPGKESRYCGLCIKNSPGLDHHCTWLNTCIADSNYEAFYWLVVSATCQTSLQTVIGILMCTVWKSEVISNAAIGWDTTVITLLWIHNEWVRTTSSWKTAPTDYAPACLSVPVFVARSHELRGTARKVLKTNVKPLDYAAASTQREVDISMRINESDDIYDEIELNSETKHLPDSRPWPHSTVALETSSGIFQQKLLLTLNKMRHVAALLLCVLGGNATPTVADLEKVVKSFGGEFDKEQAEKLLKELEGKNIEEVIEAGKAKLATVSVGAAPAASGAGAAAAPAKVEEKVVEEEEEVDMGGGMDMFGGDEDY